MKSKLKIDLYLKESKKIEKAVIEKEGERLDKIFFKEIKPEWKKQSLISIKKK